MKGNKSQHAHGSRHSARMALHKARRRAAAGFTLIELMIVAVVLAILAAAVIPNIVGRTEKARRARAQSDIAAFETLLDLYYLDMGRYPDSDEGLRVLYYVPDEDEERWGGPYMKKPTFTDAWGGEYEYRIPGTYSGQAYEIVSYGKDGEEGGEGDDEDVQSWVDTEFQ